MIDHERAGSCAGCRHWGAIVPSNRMVANLWATCDSNGERSGFLTRDDETCPDFAKRRDPADMVERLKPDKFGPKR